MEYKGSGDRSLPGESADLPVTGAHLGGRRLPGRVGGSREGQVQLTLGDRDPSGNRPAPVRSTAEAVGRGTDLRLAGAESAAEQGLRGVRRNHREQDLRRDESPYAGQAHGVGFTKHALRDLVWGQREFVISNHNHPSGELHGRLRQRHQALAEVHIDLRR
jgi:hypothetical protein